MGDLASPATPATTNSLLAASRDLRPLTALTADKFSPEFLEDRRPRLQRFLRTVMLHPEMGVGGERSVLAQWVISGDKQVAPPRNRARLGFALLSWNGAGAGAGGEGGEGSEGIGERARENGGVA